MVTEVRHTVSHLRPIQSHAVGGSREDGGKDALEVALHVQCDVEPAARKRSAQLEHASHAAALAKYDDLVD